MVYIVLYFPLKDGVSVDIPLSHYSDLDLGLMHIFLFKVDGGDGATSIWFDNWYFYSTTTGVEENLVPEHFALQQNFPNPFNPSTTIRYSLIETRHVVLKLYSINGQEVATLVNAMASSGEYSYHFDASHLAAGTYIYSLTAGSRTEVQKMVLIK